LKCAYNININGHLQAFKGEIEVVGLFFHHSPFIGTGLDLVQEDIPGPAKAGSGLKIPKPGCGADTRCPLHMGGGPAHCKSLWVAGHQILELSGGIVSWGNLGDSSYDVMHTAILTNPFPAP